jgi:RNAse (barnase) inhibitor barstar
MSSERPWVRQELPWLRSGPLHRVEITAETHLNRFLDRFGYRRIELQGTRMTSRSDAHDELARAFGFPDYYGKNWDAFGDCLGDYLSDPAQGPHAVIWRHFAEAAAIAPATAVEVAWALLEAQVRWPGGVEGQRWSASLDFFVLGSGAEFDGP